MEVESFEIAGLSGQDFVIYGKEQEPKFEARLLLGSKILKIMWTDNIAWTPFWLRNVQRLAGGAGAFDSIEGFASDEFALAIHRGEIDERGIASRIMRARGGRWLARISRVRDDWIDINVNRIGG